LVILPRLHAELERDLRQIITELFGRLALLRLESHARPFTILEHGAGVPDGFDRLLARNEKIAGVPVRDANGSPAFSQPADILEQNDLHQLLLVAHATPTPERCARVGCGPETKVVPNIE